MGQLRVPSTGLLVIIYGGLPFSWSLTSECFLVSSFLYPSLECKPVSLASPNPQVALNGCRGQVTRASSEPPHSLPPRCIHMLCPQRLCVYVQSLQSCLTLRPYGLLTPLTMGILQARILERVTMPSSRGSSQPRDGTSVSCIFCIASRFLTAGPRGKPIYRDLGSSNLIANTHHGTHVLRLGFPNIQHTASA